MDTISFRVKSFTIRSEAEFNSEFSYRNFSDLSEKEKAKSKDPKIPYLRKFISRSLKAKEEIYSAISVEVYEKADINIGKVMYEMIVTIHSLPKLLHENSVEEILPSDKDKLVNLIHKKIWDAGIHLSKDIIKRSPISVVHFCKNIVLPKKIALRSILAELSNTDMGKAYDTTEDVRRQRNKNGSKVVHLFCGTREWCFYDKAEDTRQRKKSKRVDKIETPYEKELFTPYLREDLEIFRYEYRLNKIQTIRRELHTFLKKDSKESVTFDDLFTEGLWKAVLIKSWKSILTRPENQLALLSYTNSLDLLLHISRNAKSKGSTIHSQNKALWTYGLVQAIKDNGAKTVKSELNKVWANKDERLIEKLNIAIELIKGIPTSEGISYISKKLEKFEIINLASLEEDV